MKYQITKTFRFEAGHRVWTQDLSKGRGSNLTNKEICHIENKCRHIHGHSYILEVTLGSDTLENGMVMDFYHLKTMIKDLIEHMDHSLIIDKNDPIFPYIEDLSKKFNLKLFIVDFVPTSEALAQYIFKHIKHQLIKAGLEKEVKIIKVVLWETSTSKVEYSEEEN